MALIECPECKRNVSDAAVACPQCGYPIAAPNPRATAPLIQPQSPPVSQSPPFSQSPPYFGYPQQPFEPMPQTYLPQAILATLFCCLPLGIVAIYKSSQVSSAYASENMRLARQYSEEAGNWVNSSAILGVFVAVIYVVIAVLANSR